jgi:predicted glutamine amidotransferase
MCKIIAFTDMKKVNLKKCVNDIGNTLLKSEKDGFGYAVQGKSGVYGEKTTATHFRSRLGKESIQLPIIKNVYAQFGQPNELTGPGVFHGRTSTNSEGLVNTHPMQRPDATGVWHLIHNGVVTDKGPSYDKLTRNDSEDVLFRLMEGIQTVKDGLTDNPMESIEKHLEGYYAFAAIDTDGRLHLCRDSYADLYMAWSASLNTYIIATTEGLVNKLNKMLDAKIGPIDAIEDDVYMVFEGNELIYHQFIQPLGFTRVQAAKSGASLGRELSPAATTSLGGEVIVRSPMHHRPESVVHDDSRWVNDWDSTMDVIRNIDSERLDDEEVEYYAYRRELDNMSDEYTIADQNDNYITVRDFYKLDFISQEQCTIVRPDGTIVEFENENYKHLA